MPTLWKLLGAAAVLLGIAVPAPASNEVTLRVQLDRLRGADLLPFMRAAVPELSGYGSATPTDLKTLATLHRHFQENWFFRTREQESEGKGVREGLGRLMRERIAQTPLVTLRRPALGDGKQDFGNYSLREALYHELIEQEVTRICSKPKAKLLFPIPPAEMPKRLQYPISEGHDPAPLLRAMGPLAAMVTELEKQGPRPLSKDSGSYEKLRDELLSGGKPRDAKALLNYTRDSLCGYGSEFFWTDQMTLMLLGLLRERRIAEAVGISFLVPDAPEWLREPGSSFDQWRIDLLEYAGIDWEETMLSGGRYAFLAAAGSEKAARHILATTKAPAEKDVRWADLETLAGFLAPAGSGDSDEDPRNRISSDTQKEILQLLDSVARQPRNFAELGYVLEIMANHQRPDMKDTLWQLISHESTTYAQRAATILSDLGERVNTVQPAAPVRFRLFLNGAPMRFAELSYASAGAHSLASGGPLVTDSEGYTSVPRDVFLDPGLRNLPLIFRKHPPSGSPATKEVYERAWIQMTVAPPEDFSAISQVHFTTCRLPLEITYPAPPRFLKDAPMEITLVKVGERDENAARFGLRFAEEGVKAPTELVFGAIQPGMYQVLVKAPGIRGHETAPFEVKEGMEPVKIALEKVTNVYGTVLVPDNARGATMMLLLRDGSAFLNEVLWEYGYQWPLFAGLQNGEYELRVLSSAEYMKWMRIKAWGAPERSSDGDPRESVDCKGVVKKFTVSDETPQFLDLGELVNPPTDAMKSKAGAMRRLGSSLPK